MKHSIPLFATLVLAASAFAEIHTYTSAQTVDTIIGGSDSVVVDIPTAPSMSTTMTGWKIVDFTGNNSFTGDVEVKGGCIAVSHTNALGTGRIKMHPGTAILVKVDYRSVTGGLKAAIIDRIDVVEPSAESWVAFMIFSDGLKNDVDFSMQPYLWLSAPKRVDSWTNTRETYSGTHTPYGDTYKFGYNFVTYTEAVGLEIKNLVDMPNGTPRKVVVANGIVTLGSGFAITGGVTVKTNGTLAVTGDTTYTAPTTLMPEFFVFENGSQFALRSKTIDFSANYGWKFTGTVKWAPSGNTDNSMQIKFRGPISGTGTLDFRDNGSIVFLSDANTFSGIVQTWNCSRTLNITIGDNTAFSWGTNTHFNFASPTAESGYAHYLHLKPKSSGSSFELSYSGNPTVTVEGTGSMALSAKSSVTVASSTISLDPLNITAGKTYTFNDQGGYNARIIGSGSFTLAAGAVLPTLDLLGYEGALRWNGSLLNGISFGDTEVFCPTSSVIQLGSTVGPSQSGWTFNGPVNEVDGHTVHCYPTNFDGRAAFTLDDGCHWDTYSSAYGGVIYGNKIDVMRPFTVDFDFFTTAPAPSSGEYGDGFCFALQDQQTSGSREMSRETGCDVSGSVSLTAWAFDKKLYLANNKAALSNGTEAVAVTKPFGITGYPFQSFSATNPLHVHADWDGTDLVFTLDWNGQPSETLSYSGADLATKFPDGAYLSFYSRAAGWYCRKFIDRFGFAYKDDIVTGTGATLKFGTGTANLIEDGSSILASSLVFAGTTTLAASKTVTLTDGEWTFDFSNGVPCVTLGSQITLSADEISVKVLGEVPKTWTTVADLSALDAGDLPTFTLENSKTYGIRIHDGLLQLLTRSSFLILLR